MKQNDAEPTWNDMAPNELVPEPEVPEQAAELKRITDSWLDKNAKNFDLFEWEGMGEKFWRNKAFNEAGVYLLNVLNHGENGAVPELKELIIEKVNDRRFVQLMLRNPRQIHFFAYPPLYARCIDSLGTNVATVLRQIGEQGEFWSSERLPFRYLEFCYLCKIFNIQHEHNGESILKYSLLNHKPNIILSECSDAYCLTHDVMFGHHDKLYYNNLDADDQSTLGTPTSYDISSELRGLILRFMAKDNADITLELLLTGILQKQISREMVRIVLSWILEKTQAAGYVPGPAIKSMNAPMFSRELENGDKSPWQYEYKDKEDEIWAKNYHTNIVAGMTARVLGRDWNKLNNRQMDHTLKDHTFREDCMRLGQLLSSLGDYDLDQASHQMIDLAGSPVTMEFPYVFQEAVDFLEDQRTQDGEFGYWTTEEIIYVNKGNSRESFRNELIEPVNDACQKALNAARDSSKK